MHQVKKLASKYTILLETKFTERSAEMASDDRSHHLIYQVLGISAAEGELIDIYQNKGRFLYRYAGAFLEEATIQCLRCKFPDANTKFRIPNTISDRPDTFEIDCLVHNEAFEIKWRDATTDGDHIVKEHTRVKAIQANGFIPIRVMFYTPNRKAAINIQNTLKTVYAGLGGKYYARDEAWSYVHTKTNIDLQAILTQIANEKSRLLDRKQ